MDLFYPAYYQTFRCIAANCPDSCCKEWAVDVDPSAAQYYRSLPGALGDRLREVLQDTDEGTIMAIENGRCPMWQTDGLCQIQAELGHDALCETCRTFPRLCHDYGTFQELGLELSCPEAARLILADSDRSILQASIPQDNEPDYDLPCMSILLETRTTILDYLTHASCSPEEALAVFLLYSHSVQDALDGGALPDFSPDDLLLEAKQYALTPNIDILLDFFLHLELLTTQWKERLLHPQPNGETDKIPALAEYLIRRYWLQAVSDYDLIGRAKLIVSACILITRLGGDFVETAQLFSKEIENDPDNVDAILDGAYTSHALTDVNLLSLLMKK